MLAALLGTALTAAAQPNPWPAPVVPQANPWAVVPATAAPVAAAPALNLGSPLSVSGGPWVPAEVLFFSAGQVVADYAWRDSVRARRGHLYTAADLQSDVQDLMTLGRFTTLTPAIYAIPATPVPSEFSAISVSTNQVRVVFDVMIKVVEAPKVKIVTPPTAVGGVLLTPTAWRGAGRFENPGLALDINAAYFIGRLYGKNSYPDAPRKTNYIDRIGLWTLTADGKMQVQSETKFRPAIAVGGQAMLLFRDSPQPTVTAPGVSVKIDTKNTKVLTDGYFVASKKLGPVRTSAGVMQGTIGNLAANMSEFLTPEALKFYLRDTSGTQVVSRTVPFASVFYLIKPDYPIGVELMKFNGAARNPMLINFKLGRFLKLNFDLALLKYQGGYDMLGFFQFRYNHFPKK
ncbi:MAG: hypothetical protein PHS14_07585 [Elusimicrobia bacterium]|nr:hypothetical protein [Elusimicrobiota bacterium]